LISNAGGRGRRGQRGVAASPAITAALAGIMVRRWPAPDPGEAGAVAICAGTDLPQCSSDVRQRDVGGRRVDEAGTRHGAQDREQPLAV
jgi:hypothetical protein